MPPDDDAGTAGLTYSELIAAVDRAFAGPADQPLPLGAFLAELQAPAPPTPISARAAPPDAAPEPG